VIFQERCARGHYRLKGIRSHRSTDVKQRLNETSSKECLELVLWAFFISLGFPTQIRDGDKFTFPVPTSVFGRNK